MEWSIWSTGPGLATTVAGYLWENKAKIMANYKARKFDIPYDLALFLEYTTKKDKCFGKSGNITIDEARRKEKAVEPLPDIHNKADNLLTDILVGAEVGFLLSRYLGSKFEFKKESDPITKLWDHGFSFGGPIPNDTTEEVLKLKKVDISFDLKNPHYPLITPIETYTPTYNSDIKTYEIDYGAILRLGNPRRDKKRLVVMMGCKGYGTEAASKVLTNPKLVEKDILKEINDDYKDRDFCLIIESKINTKSKEIEKITLQSLTSIPIGM